MKRSYKITGLDCAVCATNLEEKLCTLSGVESASLSFMSGRLNIEIADSGAEQTLQNIVHTIENFESGLAVKRV